jgi:hypothetical protein
LVVPCRAVVDVGFKVGKTILDRRAFGRGIGRKADARRSDHHENQTENQFLSLA